MALGDVYQLKVQGSVQFEECEMVHYYRQTTALGSAEDLATAYRDLKSAQLRAVMNPGAFINSYFCINGMNNADFFLLSDSQPGTLNPSAELPSFAAFAFRSPYMGPGTRYTYKRLWGVSAGIFNPTGGGIGPGLMALLQQICDSFGAITAGQVGTYEPVQITGGFRLGVAPTVSQVLIGQWLCYYTFTTQKSRQQYSWV